MPFGHNADGTNTHRSDLDARCEMGVAFFGLSVLVYFGVAIACVLQPPVVQTAAGGVAMPNVGLTCLRATRNADYATVDVPVGTPFRLMTVVLRMDKAVARDDATPTLQLFAPEVVESETVDCDGDTNCEDVALLYSSPNGEAASHIVSFRYRHHLGEQSVAYSLSGVSGELFLRGGKQYWLTTTHLCYANDANDANDAPDEHSTDTRSDTHAKAQVDGSDAGSDAGSGSGPTTGTGTGTGAGAGALGVPRSDLAKLRGVRDSPVLELDQTECGGDAAVVELFPEQAAIEPEWLRISDMTLYNSEPESVARRRAVAELGTSCASSAASIERDLMLYQLDCRVVTETGSVTLCRSEHSLPFRRLATASVHIAVAADGASYWIATDADSTLDSLARLAGASVAFSDSLIKLGMITLAAAVVYVRSRRATSSSSWLLKHAVRSADKCDQTKLAGEDVDVAYTFVQDGIIGAVAVVARLVIAFVRWDTLTQDGQWRVPIVEVAAGVCSVLHLFARYLGFLPLDADDPPVSKLGGATAIVDSTCGVMVAFAEAPTMVVSIGRFNPTARLLTALLISLIVVTRCAFSAASCGVLWETEDCPTNPRYGWSLVLSGLMWAIVQTTALAVVVADLFVAPASYSMSRLIPGDPLPARVVLFFTLVCAGLPRFTRTIRHILSSDKTHKD